MKGEVLIDYRNLAVKISFHHVSVSKDRSVLTVCRAHVCAGVHVYIVSECIIVIAGCILTDASKG